MPVLEQLVDLEVQEGGTICIAPRALRPVVGLHPFLQLDVEQASATQTHLQEQLALLFGEEGTELTPFEMSRWEHLLDAAATRLSADARHVPRELVLDGRAVEAPSPTLTIWSSWAVYGRPRSDDQRQQDLATLRASIEAADDDGGLPDGLRGFVSVRSDGDREGDDWGLTRDLGASTEGASRRERDASTNADASERAAGQRAYFFPLAFNQEQAQIIDRLETEAVVTVTGPPGTGKTHTIANIISHYMATGRRVLVTARTAEAIAAVREKLPKELARLVIASVSSDREGNRQLQEAIEHLSAEVVSLDVGVVRDEQQRLEARILVDEAAIRDCDEQLAAIADANLRPSSWSGDTHVAMALLERLDASAEAHAWFVDRPPTEAPDNLAAKIDTLRTLLPTLAGDLMLSGVALPEGAALPEAGELIAAHGVERAHRRKPSEDFGSQPPMNRSSPEDARQAANIERLLTKAASNLRSAKPWVRTLLAEALHARVAGNPWPDAFDVARESDRLLGDVAGTDVVCDAVGTDRQELSNAIAKGCRGDNPVPFMGKLFKPALVSVLDAIRVAGERPTTRTHWQAVADSLAVEELRPRIVAIWDTAARSGQLPRLPHSTSELVAVVRDACRRLSGIEKAAERLAAQAQPLGILFPAGLAVRRHLGELDLDPLIAALRANLADTYASPAAIGRLSATGALHDAPLFSMIAELAAELGSDSLEDADIVTRRNAIVIELERVRGLTPSLAAAERLLGDLSEAGAPDWSERCRAAPEMAPTILPEDWLPSWGWAVARRRVDKIVALGNGDEWRTRKTTLKARRERDFEALIRARTLLGLKRRMTPDVQTALKMFTAAVTKLGKGTGKGAGKWRRAIRSSALQAAPAAPVWIMPEYKIAEQLPAKLADFDLVILDEASQSDITSIGALARGARQLIVGDEKQVSPSVVGIPLNRIELLVANHLRDLPNREVIDQETSIFDVAVQMHPHSHLMLREHFRCVEPIIGFSARFYGGRLVPLRIPKASERFDPPLVDILVRGAKRIGKTNPAEADVIVEEIAALVSDPAYERRGIAVISLIGGEQADLIERRLMADPRVGTRMIERHRILCGDSRTMQGQERDIVFLSMVATPDTAVKDDRAQTAQRFNVALSRARDRMYLVRSVAADELKLGDLKLAAIEHFADPMPAGRRIAGADTLARCDSGFERDVCARLLDANYRVRAQVAAGPYRIDLVVEGADDRRLAIELDGDHWHGADRWHDDMARQAALERAGWTFWRVFGSQWTAECM